MHLSIIGKYERDEVKPSIDVVKRLADMPNTTVGFLLGEPEDRALLMGPIMMKRLNDIATFPKQDETHILYIIDTMIICIKLKAI